MAELCVTQAILESGVEKNANGEYVLASKLAKEGNNFFGIKAVPGQDSIKKNTREETANGASYYIDADFARYANLEDAVKGYRKFMEKDRYAGVWKTSSIGAAAQAVKDAGYATDTKYPQKLKNINKTYSDIIQAGISDAGSTTQIASAGQQTTQYAYQPASYTPASTSNTTAHTTSSSDSEKKKDNDPLGFLGGLFQGVLGFLGMILTFFGSMLSGWAGNKEENAPDPRETIIADGRHHQAIGQQKQKTKENVATAQSQSEKYRYTPMVMSDTEVPSLTPPATPPLTKSGSENQLTLS